MTTITKDHGFNLNAIPDNAESPSPALGKTFAAMGTVSDSCYFYDSGDYHISDGGFSARYFNENGCAPAGAVVTKVEYRLRVAPSGAASDFYCGDYKIYLSSSSSTSVLADHLVYDRQGARTDSGSDDDAEDDSDIYLNWRSTDYFNGESANQYWGFRVEDVFTGDTGMVDYFSFRIYYTIQSLNVIPEVSYIQVNNTAVGPGGSITVMLNNLQESFEVRLRCSNTGTEMSPASFNNITMSFPQLSNSQDHSHISISSGSSGDLTINSFYGCCEINEGWPIGGGDQYADYCMIEAADNSGWASGESNTLIADITPKQWGSFKINFRMALADSSWARCVYDPVQGYPASSNSDCLNYECYSIIINVIENPNPPMPAKVEIREVTVNYFMPYSVWLGQLPAYINMGDNLEIKGRVLDQFGNPFPNTMFGVHDAFQQVCAAKTTDASGNFIYNTSVPSGDIHCSRNMLFFVAYGHDCTYLNFAINIPSSMNLMTNAYAQSTIPRLNANLGFQVSDMTFFDPSGNPIWVSNDYVTSLFHIQSASDVNEDNYFYILQQYQRSQTDPFYGKPEILDRAKEIDYQLHKTFFDDVIDNTISQIGPGGFITYIGAGGFCASTLFGNPTGPAGCVIVMEMAAQDVLKGLGITLLKDAGASQQTIDMFSNSMTLTFALAGNPITIPGTITDVVYFDYQNSKNLDVLDAGYAGYRNNTRPFDVISYTSDGNNYSFDFTYNNERYSAKARTSGTTQNFNTGNKLPETVSVGPAFPNPFNPDVIIPYSLPQKSLVTIKVCSATGQVVSELVNGEKNTGYHSIAWDGKMIGRQELPSGLYILQLKACNKVKMMKLIYQK